MKEHEIVTLLNNSLRLQFAAKRFQKGSFDGIAELVKRDEETTPCIVSNNGDITKLVIDDTKPFQVYHRTLKAEFENSKEDFGDRRSISHSASMLMIVIGDRNRLQLTKEDLIAGVTAGWLLVLPKSSLNTLDIKSCDIVPGSFNTDRESVYKGEYANAVFSLKPNYIMFSFSYQIVTQVDQACFTLCE